MCVLGNSQAPVVGMAASECGEGLWGVGGPYCCTFEHLFLITSFVLDDANGSQTRHTYGDRVKRPRWCSGTRGHTPHRYPTHFCCRAGENRWKWAPARCSRRVNIPLHTHRCAHRFSDMDIKAARKTNTGRRIFLVASTLPLARMARLSHRKHTQTHTQAKYVLIASMRS